MTNRQTNRHTDIHIRRDAGHFLLIHKGQKKNFVFYIDRIEK